MNQLELLKQQLQIAKTASETVKTAIESASMLIEDLTEEPNQNCQHPEETRESMKTMGGDGWYCRQCGYIYDPSEEVR